MCRFLLSLALVAVVSSSKRSADGTVVSMAEDVFDPTIRDWSEKCNDLAKFSGENYCTVFEYCCSHDPLNGDKCQNADKICVYNSDEAKLESYKCILSNCTEMVTTTAAPTTTTVATDRLISSTNRIYAVAASFFSLWMLLV